MKRRSEGWDCSGGRRLCLLSLLLYLRVGLRMRRGGLRRKVGAAELVVGRRRGIVVVIGMVKGSVCFVAVGRCCIELTFRQTIAGVEKMGSCLNLGLPSWEEGLKQPEIQG
jgi:hypothetical protein